MSIGFNNIQDLRVPFVAVEFDNSRAQQGPAVQPFKTLMLGQKLSGGTATALVPVTVASEAQARTLFGAGSMLQLMVKNYLANDKVTELVVLPCADNGTGTAATGKIVFTGPATEDGTLYLYIAGKLVTVAVLDGDTAAEVCTAVVAAINADTDLPLTAAVDGSVPEECDLTAKHKGVSGSEIDVRFNYQSDEASPAGVGHTITAMASGAGNPDVSTVIAVIPEEQYNVIVNPWTDSTNLGLLETELAARFGPSEAIDGVMISTKLGSLGTLQTLGNARNSPHSVINGPAKSGPTWPCVWSASVAGQVAKSAQIDPARPFQTLPLAGVLVPAVSERFLMSERNTLLTDGIATQKVVGSEMTIERLITTYQTNGAGQADTSYLDATSLFNLSYLRYSFRARFALKYPRHKLASDGTRAGPGQPVVTPSVAKAEVIALFNEWERMGLVEGADQFARDLVIERNASNPNRLDFLLPPDLVNSLINVAAQIQFLI